ncbi:choline ABC transporter permease subunit [Stagnihabitans tardus]|uniref:Choline ABC transporter permease subunit n=1 Tax=Stagnihabitans tardus TaxID=2699202 RepID=A0AAE5BW85_9RHOB|nr:choline ABC transporter permease subunit [Stagnihabitans tardus]NBZ88053.1 choline ABC transporter permease subunit [Stagnihabitans tardus]
MDFLSSWVIPVGATAKWVFDGLKANFKPAFKAFGDATENAIEGLTDLLQWPHALVVVALFVALTWVIQRRWQPCVIVALGFLFILNQGYWKETTETLGLVAFVCIICMAIGVPMGVLAAHRPRLYQAMQPVLDLMQTLPAPVYLIPFVILFGIGLVPALFASIIFVVPTSIRLTHLGVSSTPTALLEAATSFGATPRQVLWKVELPWARPQIMAGLNQTIMLSLSMVVISAWVGAAGLGVPVVKALNQVRPDLGFESGTVIVALAILLDRMLRTPK